MKFPGIASTDILLPNDNVDLSKWSCIACDQYTSSPDYWNEVVNYVGDEPSTLKLIQPEAFLEKVDEKEINEMMKTYLKGGTLSKKVNDGFIVLERKTESGKRIGLLAAIDLDCYDYKRNDTLIRATEGTVESRLPPRIAIRKNAPIELPHAMVLIDDKEKNVIEKLYEKVSRQKPLYDFELMMHGGHIRGWKIENKEEKEQLATSLNQLNATSGGFLYAIGDGNHSIAAAKKCWESMKESLNEEEKESSPARYALVELVNIYSPALNFEAIHRVLFDTSLDEFLEAAQRYFGKKGMKIVPGNDFILFDNTKEFHGSISPANTEFFLSTLQKFLDEYSSTASKKIDYIHGEENVKSLVKEGKNLGILLTGISKDSFFENVRKHGPYPKKTFSIGRADEKRFYLEARLIKEKK